MRWPSEKPPAASKREKPFAQIGLSQRIKKSHDLARQSD
ncbi:Uncharacterised protein [Vibrio cholerae]|nr:Uncharacterised protein [Vibrio cholerae]